jgi:hypothetical protein
VYTSHVDFLCTVQKQGWVDSVTLRIMMNIDGLCHGDMGRGRLEWTYVSREGDMSWGHGTG